MVSIRWSEMKNWFIVLMVFLLPRRGRNFSKWQLLLVLGLLFIGEYLVYFIFAMSWNIPMAESEQDLQVLLVSDPQLQGFQFERQGLLGHITRWDSYRYLKKTFSYAMDRVKPNVVILLGDLLDEGYVCSDENFLLYKDWFEQIYSVPTSVKKIHLAGDNDVGGENEPMQTKLLTRHEKHFGPTNEVIYFDNWQFLKLNTLSFLGYYKKTPGEKQILHNLKVFARSSVEKLDSKKPTVVLSHLPLNYWDPYFAVEVLDSVSPKVLFTGHDHKSKYRVYKSDNVTTEEHVIPTCSYRMGTVDMGIGVAILGKNGSFQYTLLKLPKRYYFLYFYIVVLVLTFLYNIIKRYHIILKLE